MSMTARRFRMAMQSVVEHVEYYMKGKGGNPELTLRYTADALKTWNIIPHEKYEVWGVGATSIKVLKADPIIRSTLILVEAERALEPVRELGWRAYEDSQTKTPITKKAKTKEEWR